jgi:LAO/AO transport system kinase
LTNASNPAPPHDAGLAERLLAGDPRAIARAISLVENETPAATDLLRTIFPHTGRAYLIGVTGPPGAGKSTLVDRMTQQLRARGKTVGIIAVDPTSPFSGGAILGDRVRMQAHAGDPGVFIRSMATRGHLGGLARATYEVALVLDASGKDIVLIETVGVGQDEVDVVRAADVSVVTLVPGAGDEVQALKAGIMEIADLFVVNKVDREGADRTVASIESLLALESYAPEAWRPPILRTQATSGAGVPELLDAIERFRARPSQDGDARRRVRSEFRLRELLADRFLEYVSREVLGDGEFEALLKRIAGRAVDPYSAANEIVERTLGHQTVKAALDHVGIAVDDLDRVLTFYRDALGLNVLPPEEIPSQKVRVHVLPLGGSSLELLEPTADDSPIARYVQKRGPGIHHITLRVENIHDALAQLRARGVRLIDETPRAGAEGALIAFIHPASTGGVLVELKQRG